jgi:hypothetical protein
MGGGFIEFLFGDGRRRALSGRISSSRHTSRARPLLPPMDPQQSMRQQEEAAIPRSARSIRNTKSRWSTITARKAPAPS